MLINAYGKSGDNEVFHFDESNNSVSINHFWLHSNKKENTLVDCNFWIL